MDKMYHSFIENMFPRSKTEVSYSQFIERFQSFARVIYKDTDESMDLNSDCRWILDIEQINLIYSE
jgi:hypothetical protein